MPAWLGDVRSAQEHYICGFAAGPGDLHCNRDATWHGVLLNDDCTAIVAMMESCDGHLPAVRLSADYVHPLVHPCAIPGSRFCWPENECVLDWDEQAEFPAAAERVPAAAALRAILRPPPPGRVGAPPAPAGGVAAATVPPRGGYRTVTTPGRGTGP